MSVIYQYIEHVNGKVVKIDKREAYVLDNFYYFILPTGESEQAHLEREWLASYLEQQNYLRVAKPIKSINGSFVTQDQDKSYVCLQAMKHPYEIKNSETRLAEFHQVAIGYPYMPRFISVYGSWQSLWEDKLTLFEAYYQNQLDMRPVSRYQRLLVDTFPYLIGLTENAIQYVQEINHETRFTEMDQGCITFQRYTNQLDKPFIFSNEFIFDHPARDIAEYIRPLLFRKDGKQQIVEILQTYEKTSPLSVFGWELLYARLILPIHLFDFIDRSSNHFDKEETYLNYRQMLDNQLYYEEQLRTFFKDNKIDVFKNRIHQLDW
ncbi:hypothetical protein Pryu01_02839 [Paraliobacillus ryukyuensis]|uniref:Spore coat protein YutH n=1 Tax=Paraliobacillus ryukyuensis TaxID=200904 RepID=A0A366E6U1_9BACI|nr:hypothetical protein [Paraliobacillus ryukyuensis]RBO98093.1 spore coat protein YutH [Paraliobacillus ryukyuensis]